MVVEDEPNIGALVRTYLERAGYEALWVRSGEEALAELRRHPIKLVVLDIGLPGIDGFEVCRRIGGAVPVIMLTARDEEPDRVAGLEVGRRRLRRQAVLPARADRARQGGAAPSRAQAGRLSSDVIDARTGDAGPRRPRGPRRRRARSS